ncbi:MAG: DUF6340 family protein [Prevotellaceae bacterium]|jgi:hypothetical protein|nr:DUF6340 family protein [Prevotellaceae bacterium]
MKKTLSYLLACSILFAACAPGIKVLNVESLVPAKYPVAYSDKSIAILNALHINADGTVNYADGFLANMVAKGLKDGMEASEIFRGYEIPVYNLTLSNEEQYEELQDVNYMNSIAEQTASGLLIIIDDVKIAQPQQSISQVYLNAYYGKVFYAKISVPVEAMFRYYDSEKQLYIANHAASDTILWEAIAYRATEALSNLPEMGGLDTLAAQQLGKLMAKATLPRWRDDRRYYYDLSGANGNAATAYAQKNNWEQAMHYWGVIAMESTGKTSAYAAFNMGLGAEMLGDYPLALEWLTLAKDTANFPEIDGYIKRLQQRINDKNLIQQQLVN